MPLCLSLVTFYIVWIRYHYLFQYYSLFFCKMSELCPMTSIQGAVYLRLTISQYKSVKQTLKLVLNPPKDCFVECYSNGYILWSPGKNHDSAVYKHFCYSHPIYFVNTHEISGHWYSLSDFAYAYQIHKKHVSMYVESWCTRKHNHHEYANRQSFKFQAIFHFIYFKKSSQTETKGLDTVNVF